MRLRGRFTVWFALAAVVPIAAAAIGTRQVLSDNYRQAYAQRQRSAESLASQEVARVKRRVEDSVASMAQRDHFYIGGLLVELEKVGGRLEQPALGQVLKRLNDQGKALMGAIDLDVMLVADTN